MAREARTTRPIRMTNADWTAFKNLLGTEWLRGQIESQGLSRRELARRWKPEDPETARRYIARYLGGVVPIRRTREDRTEGHAVMVSPTRTVPERICPA